MLARAAPLWQPVAASLEVRVLAYDPTLRLLARLLVPPPIDTAQRDALRRDVAALGDWRPLLHAASAQLVAPALLPALREHALDDVLGDDERQFLEAVNELNAMRNATIRSEIEALAVALDAEGIVPVVLKGNALTMLEGYRTGGCRLSGDIDLLVPDSACERAIELTRELGYQPIVTATQPLETVIHPEIGAKKGAVAVVEIHREFMNIAWRGIADGAAIAGSSRRIMIASAAVLAPSQDDLAAIVVAHGPLRDFGHYSGRIVLRAILDLVAIERMGGADWPEVRSRFAALGLASVFDAFFIQVRELSGWVPNGIPEPGLRGRIAARRQGFARRSPQMSRTMVAVGAMRLAVADLRASRALRGYLWRLIADPKELGRKLAFTLSYAKPSVPAAAPRETVTPSAPGNRPDRT